jgi:hypothetical protein
MLLFRPFFIWLILLRLGLYGIVVCGCGFWRRLFMFWLYLRHYFSFLFPLVRRGYRQDFRGLLLLRGFQDNRRWICGGFTQEI